MVLRNIKEFEIDVGEMQMGGLKGLEDVGMVGNFPPSFNDEY